MPLITSSKKKKRALDQKIAEEYNRLIAQPGNMKGAYELIVMKKYGLKSRSTVYNIINQVISRNISQHSLPQELKVKPVEDPQGGRSG